MLISSEGNENSQNKSVGLISKKKNNNNNFARAALILVHFFVVVLHGHNVKLGQKLPSYTFYGGNVVCVLVLFFFFSQPLIFKETSWLHVFTATHFHFGGR